MTIDGIYIEPDKILPCPNCNSTDVEASGDDFDGMVNCNYCKLETYICYGTNAAIKVWNKRTNIDKWQFGWNDDEYDNEKIVTYNI